MYKVVYTKTAAKDVPKLKSAHLDEKAKALIEIIRVDPFQNLSLIHISEPTRP